MLTILGALVLGITAPDCGVDRAAMLALSPHAFDQVEHQGWRALTERGCDTAAADLIEAYRAAHPDDSHGTMMRWHEGQMRANAGDYAAARPLFAASRHATDGFGWNEYVDATVAFIDRDRPRLLAARARLAATPRPETHPWFAPDGSSIPPPTLAPGEAWPYDLPVVDALIRCFDRSYKAAYMTVGCYAEFDGPRPSSK